MALISLSGVTKIFPNGFRALDGISREFAEGSFTVVVGASGAGKSTLLRTINGLELPSQGHVRIDGELLGKASLRRIRSKVGMVFQEFNLVDRLNVMTNVLTGRLSHHHWVLSLLHLFPKRDIDLARHVLHRVGLTDKAWSRADQLSGGQRQRVGIARAICQQPKLILADEPVASLDPASAVEVMDLFARICREDNITVLTSLHQLDLVRRYADRVIGMKAGQIVFDGVPGDLTAAVLDEIYRGEKADGRRDGRPGLAVAYA